MTNFITFFLVSEKSASRTVSIVDTFYDTIQFRESCRSLYCKFETSMDVALRSEHTTFNRGPNVIATLSNMPYRHAQPAKPQHRSCISSTVIIIIRPLPRASPVPARRPTAVRTRPGAIRSCWTSAPLSREEGTAGR